MKDSPHQLAISKESFLKKISSKTARRVLPAGILALILLGGIYYWYASAPYRMMLRYIQAIEDRDTQTLYELSAEKEKEELNLTPLGLSSAFENIFNPPVARDEITINPAHKRQTSAGTQYEWTVFWRDQGTGSPLPGKWGAKRPQLLTHIVVKPTPDGWRVATSLCLFSTCLGHWGYPGPYVNIARESGITGMIGQNGKLVRLESFPPETLIPPENRTTAGNSGR